MVYFDEDGNYLDQSMKSVDKKMMSLWITILMLTSTVLAAGLENGWDDFLLYDEDYEEDYDDTEDGNLDADLDYFFDYEEIGRLSGSLNSSNDSVQNDEDLQYTEDYEIFMDEAFDYEEDVDSSGDVIFQVFDPLEAEAPLCVDHNWPVLITGGVIFVISVIAIITLIIILIIKKVQAKKNNESTQGDAASENPGEIENEEV